MSQFYATNWESSSSNNLNAISKVFLAKIGSIYFWVFVSVNIAGLVFTSNK